MTEAEAIGTLESAKKCCYGDKAEVFEEAFDMAIKALEEVQRYRAIGTVEGFERAIQSSIENYNLYREYKAKVQEVAKEYGKDTNVRSKEYEDGYADGWCDCSKISQINAPYQKGE